MPNSCWLRRGIEGAGAGRNIPVMVDRALGACFSPVLYRTRNRMERFFSRIKHFRGSATRYEEKAAKFIANAQAGYHPPLAAAS
ncbi:MAG: transposase [Alphaproteobacteria bacterium]|nr:transposase [Alphaproteobacteria bacterium]MBV9967648.1 transposase [Alphaproteobacteria bacterium]